MHSFVYKLESPTQGDQATSGKSYVRKALSMRQQTIRQKRSPLFSDRRQAVMQNGRPWGCLMRLLVDKGGSDLLSSARTPVGGPGRSLRNLEVRWGPLVHLRSKRKPLRRDYWWIAARVSGCSYILYGDWVELRALRGRVKCSMLYVNMICVARDDDYCIRGKRDALYASVAGVAKCGRRK